MELKDLINGAQEAMDQGDYRLAIAASNHALVGYDACLAAHRLLGEAYLERGDQHAAVTHFERAISIDPLNVVARLGLGVAAEETKRYADAYAHYLHAWEINPALDQVRDELVRLRGLLNVEDRLHPTRAGLAGIHARCGQFARATSEWRAVLSVEPESRRARTSLAELLWRQADDAGAAAAAREALRGSPENARALAILADVERRRNGSYSADFIQRYASVDPTGEVLDYLRHWRSDTDLDALIPDSILIDDFDFDSNRSRHTSGLSRKSITGQLSASQMAAPDLWDTLVKDLATDVPHRDAPTLATGVEPFSWADGAPKNDEDTQISPTPFSADDDLGDVFPATASTAAEPAKADDLEPVAALDTVVPDEELLVRSVDVTGSEEVAFSLSSMADESALPAVDFAASSEYDDFETDLVPFSLDEVTGVVSPANRELDESMLSNSFGTLSEPVAAEPIAPVVQVATEVATADYVDSFVTADGRIDLTAGWDSLDREIEAATPSGNGGGFDSLVAELDVDGIIPFNAETESPDEEAWAPFSDVDFSATASDTPVVPDDPAGIDLALPDATGEAIELADLEAFDVNSFVDPPSTPDLGREIVAGIPLAQPSGYTELLRNVDEESLPEDDAGEHVDPFANPDSSGLPLAFDELIEVTSTDGTGPLGVHADESHLSAEPDYTSSELAAAMSAVADAGDFDSDVEGIQPFDSTLFGDSVADNTVSDLSTMEATAAEVVEPEPLVADMPGLTGFGDVAPFAFSDDRSDGADGAPVDFTDMDELPAALVFEAPAVEFAAVAEPEQPDVEVEAESAEYAAEADSVDSAVEAESADYEAEVPVDLVAENEEEAIADDLIEPQAAEMSEPETADAAQPELVEAGRRVSWPQFMSQTSMLMDRTVEGESLFARIAAQKDALIEMGVVSGGKRLGGQPPAFAAQSTAVAEPPADIPARPRIEATEQVRIDLMAMRVRLIEDDASAREIAEMLEEAIDHGLQSPLALRVLGEAYLKLGMVERAAAQFRQAMLTRRGA